MMKSKTKKASICRASAVGEHSAHGFFVCLIHHCRLSKPHFAARRLFGENMAQILAAALKLATASLLKPFGGGAPCLDLGHRSLLMAKKFNEITLLGKHSA